MRLIKLLILSIFISIYSYGNDLYTAKVEDEITNFNLIQLLVFNNNNVCKHYYVENINSYRVIIRLKCNESVKLNIDDTISFKIEKQLIDGSYIVTEVKKYD